MCTRLASCTLKIRVLAASSHRQTPAPSLIQRGTSLQFSFEKKQNGDLANCGSHPLSRPHGLGVESVGREREA